MVYFDSEAKETRMLRVFGQDVMDGTNWEIIERLSWSWVRRGITLTSSTSYRSNMIFFSCRRIGTDEVAGKLKP